MYEPVWRVPTSVDGIATALEEAGGDGKIIAGGTDLTVLMRAGGVRPGVLVDIGRVEELAFVRHSGNRIEIGALTTHGTAANDPVLRERTRVLATACRSVGSPQIRSRGTIGGNLANGSPAADSAAALLALDAEVSLRSAGAGGRSVSLESFWVGPGETVLRPEEFVHSVAFECPPEGSRSAYHKIGQRNALAIAIVSVAAVFDVDGGSVRIALGSAAPTPVRAKAAERLFESEWPAAQDREALIDAVSAKAVEASSCIDDVRASAEYRTMLVEAMTRSVLRELCLGA
jgi:CO/xanthine dehydrogenase FAD-binding subunit